MNYYSDPYFTDNERFELLKYKEGKTMFESAGKRPHKCPICEGSGKLQVNGNTTAILLSTCHGCDGKGIVWG